MSGLAVDQLWRFALALIPLAALVALLTRLFPFRPSTRHAMWLSVLAMLVVAPVLPRAPVPDLVRLARPSGGADTVIPKASFDAPTRSAPEASPPVRGWSDRTAAAPIERPERATTPPAQRSIARPAPELRRADTPAPHPVAVAGAGTDADAGTGTDAATGAGTVAVAGTDAATDAGTGTDADAVADAVAVADAGTVAVADAGTVTDAATVAVAVAVSDTDAATDAVAVAGTVTDAVAATDTDADAGTDTVAATDTDTDTDTDAATATDADAQAPSATAAWIHQLGAIRDAVLALPPIPVALWISVAAMLLGVVIYRTIRFRRLLARARPAPREVVMMVAGAAEALGVRRAPSTFVVDERISPLVWCGRDLLLLLPAGLWSQLDETGRRAVIYHELAHLRRRDHWVSWFGTLVGCLYWWHPVVWWIRRRLREEADLCCDAWVTTLLPGARRAYATALLETKRFTSLEAPAGPAVGLGVTALRARRFARRLTMIMSHQRTPQLTFAGIALAAAVIVIGWLVSPTLACPPDPAEAPKAVRAPRAPKAPRAPRALVPLEAPPAPLATHPDATTYERFLRTRGPGDTSVEQRLEQLERRLDRLTEILERRLGGAAAAPRVERLPAPMPRELDAARRAYEGALMEAESQVAPGRVYWKKYTLPECKLEAITALMSREDVPVLIRPADEHIEVQGDDQTHRIFKAFCVMIDGEDEVQVYKLPKGKLDGMIELMRMEEVPILIEIDDDRISVHGTTLEQAVFSAFVRLIAPESQAHAQTELSVIAEALVATDSPDVREHLLRDFEVEHDGVHAHMDALHAELASVHDHMSASLMAYERMIAKSEKLEEEGDHLEDEADELEDVLEELEEREEMAKAEQVRAKIAAMLASAERAWAEAEAAEAAADQHEDEYDALEDLADALGEQIEELQELLAELREQMTR